MLEDMTIEVIMTEKKIVWVDCKVCARPTRHEIMFEYRKSAGADEYPEAETWQLVKCLGCLNVSFRYIYDDYANVYTDENGDYEHESTVAVYPKTIKNHKQLDSSYHIPDVIRNVYKQTLSAYSEEAYILASMGLRATIEATCNQLKISGSSLERRIDQLFKAGYVSNGDKKLLHAIRFLGNDAAHEIREPKETELRVALDIVEHLLNSVFILEKKAKKLEMIIESYEEFLKVLKSSLCEYQIDAVMGISNILGRKRRLVTQNLASFESKLIEDIASGKINYLTRDKISKIDGHDIQLYTIKDNSKESLFDEW